MEALPDYAESLPSEYIGGSGNLPYIKFLSTKSKKFADYKLQFPNADEGSPVLTEDGVETLLESVQVHTITYFKYWGNIDASGELQAVILKPSLESGNLCTTPCINAVFVLHLANKAIPVIASFRRNTRAQFVDSIDGMINKLKDVNDTWYNTDDYHTHTKTINPLWARFTSSIVFKRGVSKTGKAKGLAYCAFNAKHQAVTIDEYKKLVGTLDRNRLNEAVAAFNKVKADHIKMAG